MLLTYPEREGRGSAASEEADSARGGFKAMLHVEGFLGTPLLVLAEGNAAIGVSVAHGSHVGMARQGTALEVLRKQAIGPADGGVGMVVWRQGTGPAVHPNLIAHWSVDHYHGGHRAGRTPPCTTVILSFAAMIIPSFFVEAFLNRVKYSATVNVSNIIGQAVKISWWEGPDPMAAPSGGWETVLSSFLIFGIIHTTPAMPGNYGWLVLSFADSVILRL